MEGIDNDVKQLLRHVESAIQLRKARNLSKAMDEVQKAVSIGVTFTSPTPEYAHSLHVKAQLYRDAGELQKSYDEYYHAYKVYSGGGNIGSALHSLWHSASVASDLEKNKEATTMFRRCLTLMQKTRLNTIEQANFFRVLAIHEGRIDNLIGSYGLWLHCLNLYDELELQEGIDESKEQIESLLDRISHLEI